MKTIWVLCHRPSEFAAESQSLYYTPQELGMEAIIVPEIPFDGTQFDSIPIDRPVVLHGGIGAVRQSQRRAKFIPGVWCNWELLSCQSYYAHWGEHLLQQHYAFYPLAEIIRLKDKLYNTFGNNINQKQESQIFIRPDSNDKIFTGAVVAEGMFSFWSSFASSWTTPPTDTLCVVARPERIICEYRLIVADGEMITGSRYYDSGIDIRPLSATEHEELAAFAKMVAAIWTPHPIFCLDIASTDNGYKILECGSINCAGFYNCDIRTIVTAASTIAEREWKEYNEP